VSQTSGIASQYESLFSFGGGTQCVWWFNNGGSQDFDFLTELVSGSIGRGMTTGDRVRTRIAGSIIAMYIIDGGGAETLVGVYRNTAYATGDAGIGSFTRAADGGDCSNFCFSSVSMSDEFVMTEIVADSFNRANEDPLSGGGNWDTSTLAT